MTPVIWRYYPGSQERFLSCPIDEALYEGTRGPGKTMSLLADYLQDVGKGWGRKWRGMLFQPEYKHLDDVIAKSKELVPRVFPGAKFNESTSQLKWKFVDGEELLFRVGKTSNDYWDYHGHEIPWQGYDELTKWASPGFYMDMESTCRSTADARMPRKRRAGTNPYGVGHNWVKARFIDPMPRGKVFKDPATGLWRVAIHGDVTENIELLKKDPTYIKRLDAITDPNKKAAWRYGSWDITSGGVIDDLFRREVHVIRAFRIPPTWKVDRSFDWGSAKPYSVGYWAESDGTACIMSDGTSRHFPPGTIFRINELYGWNGQPNEGLRDTSSAIARKIRLRDDTVRTTQLSGQVVNPGPADASIWDVTDGHSIAEEMKANGIIWEKADKKPGSRVNSLEALRERLAESLKPRMERPGIFVFDLCTQWVRTVPVIPRSETKPDDADTEAEDHAYDDTRYRVLAMAKRQGSTLGVRAS